MIMQSLKNSAKSRQKFTNILRKISKFCEMLKKGTTFREEQCKGLGNSKNQEWCGDNHVELEKRCKMSLWLQKSALIQPRTSRFSIGYSQFNFQHSIVLSCPRSTLELVLARWREVAHDAVLQNSLSGGRVAGELWRARPRLYRSRFLQRIKILNESFCRILQHPEDLRISAPLQTQNLAN